MSQFVNKLIFDINFLRNDLFELIDISTLVQTQTTNMTTIVVKIALEHKLKFKFWKLTAKTIILKNLI